MLGFAMNDSMILQMESVRKVFDATVALDDVSFYLNEREIHGLLGGNGAGKTTLMNILYGLYGMDAGEIRLHGENAEIHSPRDAIQHGIGMVHQHFLQISNFSVLHNVVLGTHVNHRFTLNLEEEEKKIRDLSERFNLGVDPSAMVEDLPMGTRQKVEILKALYRGVEIMILDEPTTNLTPQEVDALFESLEVMVDEGLSIVFITHKLKEVSSVCHRISVLREGHNILTADREESSENTLVKAMVGEDLDVKESVLFSQGDIGIKALEVGQRPVANLDGVHVINKEGIALIGNVSFQVHEKEIFGIAGVAGNGQRELAESIIGLQPIAQGSISIDGMPVNETTTAELLQSGVAYIPEDRLHDGFLPKANVAENLILGFQRQEPYSRRGFIDWKTVFEASRRLISEYNVKTLGPAEIGGNLSGGNIQRVMVARAFSRPCRFLVAHNPTRGLDISSMDFVYSSLLERKEQGMATLLLSEDLDELLLLCDRIGVIYRGEIVGILGRRSFERYEIGRLMSGITTSA